MVHEAVDAAARFAFETWPTRRPTPPRLLWAAAVGVAADQAKRALERDVPLQYTTRSFTEIAFGCPGKSDPKGPTSLWDRALPIAVPGSSVTFGGSIDRLDVRGGGAIQVTDYSS